MYAYQQYFMRIILLGLFSVFIFSCSKKENSNTVYFGGEIINPNDDYIVLYQNQTFIDSIKLDDNNRFFVDLGEKLESGLYYFTHKPERQYIFIEKGDSILIRLNTLDFDESLVFTGNGAEKNNFLIDMYLLNEDEENLILKYYTLETSNFVSKLDSLKSMKIEQYDDLINQFDLSDEAKKILTASIYFPYYKSKELYPYMHNKLLHKDDIKLVASDYYNYRNELNLNDKQLSYFGPYFSFVRTRLNSLSLSECKSACHDGNIESYHFQVHKLKLIDSIIEDEALRDNLFRNTAYEYLLKDQKNMRANQKFIKAFNKITNNDDHMEEIHHLYNSIQELQYGNKFPEISLVDVNGETIFSNDVIKGKTVFYFWSIDQRTHMKNINKKIKILAKAYPSYNFIGINISENQAKWLDAIKNLKLKASHQYRCSNANETRKFVIDDLNKVIFINEDGTIVNAFTKLYEPHFEKKLQKF